MNSENDRNQLEDRAESLERRCAWLHDMSNRWANKEEREEPP
jgi:hypothetical protein